MKHLRQYIRTILEADVLEDNGKEESLKLIQLFLSEHGTMQAIEMTPLFPDIDSRMVELFADIQFNVEKIIEYGKGNFPEEWSKDPEILRYGPDLDSTNLIPFTQDIRELRYIADDLSSSNEEAWVDTGKSAIKLGKLFQQAIRALSFVVRGKLTPEEMMNSQGKARRTGKSFVKLAERFGIHL